MDEVVREAPIEKLSPPLRAIVKKLAADVPGVTQRVFDALKAMIPDYGAIRDPAVLRDVYDSVTVHGQLWYQALLSARPPSAEDLERASAFARRRVHQGVPIAGLLRAFRVGSGVFWRTLLEQVEQDERLHKEMLFKVSPYLIYHFDVVAQAIAQAYTTEQYKRARWRDRLRHELCGIVLNRPDDEDGFRNHAQALGLDTASLHTALALRLSEAPGLSPDLDDGLDRILIGVTRALGADRERLVRTVHHGYLLLWLPVPHGETMIANEQKLAEQTKTIVSSCPNIVAAGVGLPGSGPRGWHRSADQAQKAIELGSRMRPKDAAYRYSDVVLDDAALGSDNLAPFLEALIERLSAEPHLLETLQVYFERQQHRKAVAGALNIHPNTLNYRLDRIESLLGAQLNDMGWLAKLYTALRLREISRPGAKREPPRRR